MTRAHQRVEIVHEAILLRLLRGELLLRHVERRRKLVAVLWAWAGRSTIAEVSQLEENLERTGARLLQ